MSGILAAFGGQILPAELDGAARALRRRGDRLTSIDAAGATLAAVQYDWESAVGLKGRGRAGASDDGTTAVVADASLYYLSDLERRLEAPKLAIAERYSPAQAVAAAYAAWGDAAPRHLEGDFAFALWDRARRRAVSARDFGGKRPLYYAVMRDTLVVASTLEAIAAVPGFVRRFNVAVLAETCAQFWSGSSETCYVGVYELPAGSTLIWREGSVPCVSRHWDAPEIGCVRARSLDDDAAALRELLGRAVQERLPETGPAAVWLSGGWDSSAVFAAGQRMLRASGSDHQSLVPVSISYPEGDPGREDDLIASIAKHWGASVNWLDVDRIPLLGEEPEEWAMRRDTPFAHTYEHWNRSLANASRAVGARVAFDGNGGDQLFQISDVFLSDLFRAGQWASLAREWREKGGRGRGVFFDWVIAPALPERIKGPITTRLRRRSADDLSRSIPRWIRDDLSVRHRLRERERRGMPRRPGYRGWRREAYTFVGAPMFPRAFQALSGFALDAGVELRSPLYDRRVVEFACARPREERNSGRETKRLLRAAMRGLLPDEVLSPRPRRTGVTTAYSDRRMRQEFPLLLERYGDLAMLADLGIVEPRRMRAGWDEYLRSGDLSIKIPLFLTLQVEVWLRSHSVGVHHERNAVREESDFSRV